MGATSAAQALTLNSYFSLQLTSTTGDLGMLAINYAVAKGGNSDPRGYLVRTSLDGYVADVTNQVLPAGANQAPAAATFALNAAGQATVTIRFYVWTPDPVGAYSVDFRNLAAVQANGVPGLSDHGLVILQMMLVLAALVALNRSRG